MTLQGKTYSLYGGDADADGYYTVIRNLTDLFLTRCPDEKELLQKIQDLGSRGPFTNGLKRSPADKPLILFIRKTLKDSLSVYTTGVKPHLKSLPLSQRFDSIIRTKEFQYHLYMVEIELGNRINREAFQQSAYRFALMAHCLRDFRPECKSVPGEYEAVCKECTKECFIRIGSALLKKYGIHPFISVSMDLETLFRKIKDEHHSVAALGIACVPELASGMRLCAALGIPAVGVPLDANRCARWMKTARETSFHLKELETLLR
jgi:hypothetical protein